MPRDPLARKSIENLSRTVIIVPAATAFPRGAVHGSFSKGNESKTN